MSRRSSTLIVAVRIAQVVMNRWFLSISTTAGVVLFTLGAYLMLEAQRFAMAGLFLFFAFYLPLQTEAMRDKLLKREPKMATDYKTVHGPRDTQGAVRIDH